MPYRGPSTPTLVARTGQPAPDLVGEVLPELARPLAHGLVAHIDAAGGQHLFDHAQAQRKAEIEPDGVADDLARKAVAGIGGLGGGCHAGHLPVPTLSAKPRLKLTVPTRERGAPRSSWLGCGCAINRAAPSRAGSTSGLAPARAGC